MRKALIVGIDYYEMIGHLNGAVHDAYSVYEVLNRHADGTLNFAQPKLLVGDSVPITRSELRENVEELFTDDADIAMFYFAGHGYIDEAGGFICASDSEDGHDGLSLDEIMRFANSSPAKNKIVILDSCHSGAAGSSGTSANFAEIKDGITVLTASTADQYAMEESGRGIFTSLLVDALNGAAANLIGDVTPGSVYAHIDQSLGNWAQRPVFKTNVKKFVSLRKADAPIELTKLQQLPRLFVDPSVPLSLDPSYEPSRSGHESGFLPEPDPVKTADFAILQALVKVNLVRPVGAPHMWHAAMESKACELTVLGEHYWNLVSKELI